MFCDNLFFMFPRCHHHRTYVCLYATPGEHKSKPSQKRLGLYKLHFNHYLKNIGLNILINLLF